MSFGVNDPNGFVPLSIQDVQGTPNVPYDESYFIQSEYNQNIGCGDLVLLNNYHVGADYPQGFLINYFDYVTLADAHITWGTAGPVLGVFLGVSYEREYVAGDTPYIPAWKNSWVAGTKTQGGAPAKARIIPVSYNYRYSAQMDQTGFSQAALGNFVFVRYQTDPADASKVLLGKNGSSTIYLSTTVSGAANGVATQGYWFSPGGSTPDYFSAPEQGKNFTLCQVIGFDNRNGENQASKPYGQVQVRLCDTQLPMISSPIEPI